MNHTTQNTPAPKSAQLHEAILALPLPLPDGYMRLAGGAYEHVYTEAQLRKLLERAADLAGATPSGAFPEGWKLVPIEPTDEMVEAGWDSDAADYVGEHKRIWQLGVAYAAMLAAAPVAPETTKGGAT